MSPGELGRRLLGRPRRGAGHVAHPRQLHVAALRRRRSGRGRGPCSGGAHQSSRAEHPASTAGARVLRAAALGARRALPLQAPERLERADVPAAVRGRAHAADGGHRPGPPPPPPPPPRAATVSRLDCTRLAVSRSRLRAGHLVHEQVAWQAMSTTSWCPGPIVRGVLAQ